VIVGIAGKIHSGARNDRASIERAPFEKFCKDLGERLGRHGHQIVVRSDSPDTADALVVAGYCGFVAEGGERSRLRAWVTSSRGKERFTELSNAWPGLFVPLASRTRVARSEHLIACTRCHATICVGGDERTEQIGHAVVAARRLLVPVAGSGGAARSLYDVLEAELDGFGFLPPQIDPYNLVGSPSDPALGAQLERWLDDAGAGPAVLLVHGHDHDALESTIGLLRDTCRLPRSRILVMTDEGADAATLAEKWERFAREATGAIVLATPDDEGRALDSVGAGLRSRARENVWLELGWLWSFLRGRERLLVLTRSVEGVEMERPSDLGGVQFLRFRDSVREREDMVVRFVERLRRFDRKFANVS
jgi:hypothetical protein